MLCYAILVLLDGQHTFFTHTHTHTHTHRGRGVAVRRAPPQKIPKSEGLLPIAISYVEGTKFNGKFSSPTMGQKVNKKPGANNRK